MPTGNPRLIEFLRTQIKKNGPQTFRWFMEQALYHRKHGYYASGRAAIGREGDFYTSVSISELFGKLIAQEFEAMWQRLGQPDDFTIMEQGAHAGEFARDVISILARTRMSGAFKYKIIEPFPVLQERQSKNLVHLEQHVQWLQSVEEAPFFCGVHFSNELFDALPIHLVRFSQGRWHELYVDQELQFLEGTLSSPELDCSDFPKIEGYQTEINLDGAALLRQIARKIQRGFLLAIDYGFTRDLYYDPSRTSGTLSCYRKHKRHNNPLEQIGESDLTAHVDFSTLIDVGKNNGLYLEEFTDQHHFIVKLGAKYFRDCPEGPSPQIQKELRAFQTLMHPGLMGMHFKVLQMSKGLP